MVMAAMRKKTNANKRVANRRAPAIIDHRRPFIDHVHELRRRVMYVALSVIFWSCVAYSVEHPIVDALLRPAHNQQFIYTSPGGGINFLFRVCLYVGIAASIPVIVYQLLRYVQPLIRKESSRFILLGSLVSGVLAVIGMVYGYFLGLPAALDFLLHQFVTKQIQPLLTIQSYMSFVTVYMLGSAMLLQVPLILVFINRVKPLKPQGLFKYERHVIAGAFIIAGLMNPTPNVFALFLIAGPLIAMYQVGIFIVWMTNRNLNHHRSAHRAPHVVELWERDLAVRAQRLAAAKQARQLTFADAAADDSNTHSPASYLSQPTKTTEVQRPLPRRPSLRVTRRLVS